MTKIVYLDCPTGIAGDMCLGALIDAGVPLEYLIEKLKGLGIQQEYRLRAEPVHRNGQLATKVHVDLLTETENQSNFDRDRHDPDHHHDHDHTSDLTAETTYPKIDNHHNSNHAPSRHLPEIERLITAAGLPPRACQWSLAVFRKLAEAEGAVHGIAPEQVHFHEVGATDAIVDIVGTCLGLDWLGIDQLYCSAFPTGGGTVWAAHGRLPVPVPAVLKLWESRQVPIYSNAIDKELVTPTGAAIAVTLATGFGSPPAMTLQKVGLGAGSAQLPIPNILRLWIGEALEGLGVGRLEGWKVGRLESSQVGRLEGWKVERLESSQVGRLESSQVGKLQESPALSNSPTPEPTNLPTCQPASSNSPQPANLPTCQPANLPTFQPSNSLQTISVLETQIDDLSPQVIGYVFEALFEAGAVDVFTQAIGMKKSRPGILLTVICPPEKLVTCEAVLFRETTTLGIRRLTQQRAILHREIQKVQTEYGVVRVKVASQEQAGERAIANVQPEYEDCAAIARQHNLPWRDVHQLALTAWHHQHQSVVSSQ